MTTSRTGTGRWKRARERVLADAQASGLTVCPSCHVDLDYELGKRPNSAEVDHVVPHARGGTDEPHNLRVLCRQCNQRRGDRAGLPPTPRTSSAPVEPFPWSRAW